LPLVAWCLHTIGIVQIHLGINLFWYKFYSACPDMPKGDVIWHRFDFPYSILDY
jgi:hypothetical protein